MAPDDAVTVVLVRGGADVTAWRVAWRDGVDLGTVDRLARLQVAARRLGCAIRLRGAPDELLELLDLVGLRVEVGGETEVGEERRFEEVVVPDDPVA